MRQAAAVWVFVEVSSFETPVTARSIFGYRFPFGGNDLSKEPSYDLSSASRTNYRISLVFVQLVYPLSLSRSLFVSRGEKSGGGLLASAGGVSKK